MKTAERNRTSTEQSLVCHCERVPYAAVDAAIDRGSRSLGDLQRRTRACTRCFGCRFELEQILKHRLGASYVDTPNVTRVNDQTFLRRLLRRRMATLPRRMYMPYLHGYDGSEVRTRIIVFNAPAGEQTAGVNVRLDLLTPAGERLAVVDRLLPAGESLIVDEDSFGGDVRLEEGYGAVKMVVDSQVLHSLRPYFQLVTPGGITTTHEKAGTAHPREIGPRPYHWLHPIGKLERNEEAYFFCTNTQERVMDAQELRWARLDGDEEAYVLPSLELDGSVLVPFGRAFSHFDAETAPGTVRLDPALHKVAGFMLRHDQETDRWRVQHL
jgi:bacterioferritin-associated ferredoxin